MVSKLATKILTTNILYYKLVFEKLIKINLEHK